MRYKIKITGHAPPFEWAVLFQESNALGTTSSWKQAKMRGVAMKPGENGGTSMQETQVECKGSSLSFDDALMDAREAAQSAEWERTHKETVYEEEYEPFDVDAAIRSIPDAI